MQGQGAGMRRLHRPPSLPGPARGGHTHLRGGGARGARAGPQQRHQQLAGGQIEHCQLVDVVSPWAEGG